MTKKMHTVTRILMMSGLFVLGGQVPAMASENLVTLQVPISISGISDADARNVNLYCVIGRAGQMLSNNGNRGQALQLAHGRYSGTAVVRIQKSRRAEPFRVGTPYRCDLYYRGNHNMSALAKPGTRSVTTITGHL